MAAGNAAQAAGHLWGEDLLGGGNEEQSLAGEHLQHLGWLGARNIKLFSYFCRNRNLPFLQVCPVPQTHPSSDFSGLFQVTHPGGQITQTNTTFH